MGRGRDPAPEQLGPEQFGSWQRGQANVLRFDPTRLRDRESGDPPANVPEFAELAAATNYSFLRGASHPHEMVARAIELGHSAIGIADRNTVAGVVRARIALRNIRDKLRDDFTDRTVRTGETPLQAEERRSEAGKSLSKALFFRLVTGARLCFADGTPDIVAYPLNRKGWGRLTRLLTVGNLKPHVQKGDCDLRLSDLLQYAQDMALIVMAGEEDAQVLTTLRQALPTKLWLGAMMPRSGPDLRRLGKVAAMAARLNIPLLATCDALYAGTGDRPLHDIVTCIREGMTLQEAGKRLHGNAERHLKPAWEMLRLFRDYPQAVDAWRDVVGRIGFDLGHLQYEYPHEPVPGGWEPQAWLEH
jgi:error-prone DNA polymerase